MMKKKHLFRNYNYDQILEKDDIKIYKLMAVARKDKLELVDKAKQSHRRENRCLSMLPPIQLTWSLLR